MNNFLLLTKVFFLSGFNTNKKLKKNGMANSSALKTLGIFGLLFLALSIFVNFSMYTNFKTQNVPLETYLSMIIGMSAVLTFILTMYQMQTLIFKTADYEILESLPVKKTTIVAAKITSVYLISFAEDAILILPAAVFYMIGTGNYLVGVMAIILSIFVSFVPLALTSLIGLISALVTAKSKHSSLLSIIVSVLFFAAFFVGYMYVVYSSPTGLASLVDGIFLLRWLLLAFSGQYYLYFIVLAIDIVLAAFVIVLIALCYRPVNNWLLSNQQHVEYKGETKQEKSTTLFKTLLKKEWNMLYRKTNYIINSFIGPVFFIFIALFFIFGSSLFIPEGTNVPQEEMALIEKGLVSIIPAMALMMNSIATSTPCSISFEKREGFEMLNTYPISPKEIVKAKVALALIVNSILCVLTSTIVIVVGLIAGKLDLLLCIEIFVYPLLASTFLAIIGMICGLKWPKLDFENDTQVLKRSGAVNYTMLFAFLPTFIYMTAIIVSTFVTMGIPELAFVQYVVFGIIVLIYTTLISIFSAVLNKKAEYYFYNVLKNK